MDLCTPAFGYASILPREAGGAQPAYQQFREEVVATLRKIESEAQQHGIEAEDARQACYALSFFMDKQVAESSWNGKDQWAAEPLGIMLQQDPEGGVNFFRRLESFGDRQKEVKAVYLVCLALGFRGKYAEVDPAQQAAQIAEIRQRVVRGMHPQPLDKQPELFPEGYQPAAPIEDEVPRPPRWWMFTSLGIVLLFLLVWVLLFLWAGRSPRPATETVRDLLRERPAPATRMLEPQDVGPTQIEGRPDAASEEGGP